MKSLDIILYKQTEATSVIFAYNFIVKLAI